MIALERNAVYYLNAYIESDPVLKRVVRDMVKIINDPGTDDDDREMAMSTIRNALFPSNKDTAL